MSEETKPRRGRARKSEAQPAAPPEPPKRRGRRKGSPSKTAGPMHLTPIQVRVLDALMDPNTPTFQDAAKKAGVLQPTLSIWMTRHPRFVEEYYRRIRAKGDELVALNVRATRLAFEFHIRVLSDTAGTYTPEDKRKSAAAIFELNRGRLDQQLTVQQVVVQNQVSVAPADAIPSVHRFEAQGHSTQAAYQRDAAELRLLIEQMAAGALQVGSRTIEGEVIDGDR